MDTPQFSVIVPVYNVENYLFQCVGSVLSQTGSLECILVDDGSTDKCPQMCDAFAQLDPRVRVIHQKNQGLAGARTSGMRLAQGEWLLFLDSDDYWPQGMLEQLTARMAAHPGFDLYVGSYLELDEATGTIAPPGAVRLEPGEFESDSYPARVARFYNSAHWSVWKLALRRAFALEHGLWFYAPAIYAEDLPFDLELLQVCRRFCFLDLVMVIYRANRQGSLMNVNLPKHFRGLLASYRHFAPQLSALPPEVGEEILARLANSFWPDLRAASAQSPDEQAKCLPLILELKPLWNKGDQNRGRPDWTLYRLCLQCFGPRAALALGGLFHRLRG